MHFSAFDWSFELRCVGVSALSGCSAAGEQDGGRKMSFGAEIMRPRTIARNAREAIRFGRSAEETEIDISWQLAHIAVRRSIFIITQSLDSSADYSLFKFIITTHTNRRSAAALNSGHYSSSSPGSGRAHTHTLSSQAIYNRFFKKMLNKEIKRREIRWLAGESGRRRERSCRMPGGNGGDGVT